MEDITFLEGTKDITNTEVSEELSEMIKSEHDFNKGDMDTWEDDEDFPNREEEGSEGGEKDVYNKDCSNVEGSEEDNVEEEGNEEEYYEDKDSNESGSIVEGSEEDDAKEEGNKEEYSEDKGYEEEDYAEDN